MTSTDDSAERRRAAVAKYNAKRRAERLANPPVIPAQKACVACGETKAASEFDKHLISQDGLRPRCKICRSEEHAAKQDEKGRKRRMSAALMERLGIEMPAPPVEDTPDGPIMRVPLGDGEFAVINADDWPKIAGRHWYKIDSGYAVTNEPTGSARRIAYMHVVIFDDPDAPEVDHRDRDKLNNRRRNLRAASHQLNSANTGKRPDSTAPFKCVRQLPSGRWQARIRVDGRERNLGVYATAEQAAHAYDESAREVFGEFAGVNFEA